MKSAHRTLKLTVQFDGTDYHGWQIQPDDRTVQQVLTRSLEEILNEPVTLHGSGRTDAGVHALGQVAHVGTTSGIGTAAVVRAVNSRLPPDIAVTAAEEVPADFHARYSARSRVYWYLIWNAPQRSVFFNRYAWHITQQLDLASMRDAAAGLVGTHDFTSFKGADKDDVNPTRHVERVRFKRTRRSLIVFEIRANAFVRHMVRNIIGTLVDVGRGRLTAGTFSDILQACDRTCAGMTAPPHGLFLKNVLY